MRRLLLLAVLAGLGLLAACTQSKGLEVVEATPSGPPQTLVVLGGGESDGEGVRDDLRDLWARQVYDALPVSTTYVNLASAGVTMADVEAVQVPEALALEPDTVLLWSLRADLAGSTTVEDYRTALAAVIGAFGEDTDVVVLDDPGGPYSAAVTEVVDAAGATTVDLGGVEGDPPDQAEVAARVQAALEELDGGG